MKILRQIPSIYTINMWIKAKSQVKQETLPVEDFISRSKTSCPTIFCGTLFPSRTTVLLSSIKCDQIAHAPVAQQTSNLSQWHRSFILLPLWHSHLTERTITNSSPHLLCNHRICDRRSHLVDYVWPSPGWPCHWLYRANIWPHERGRAHCGQWSKGGRVSDAEECSHPVISTEKCKNEMKVCSREARGKRKHWVRVGLYTTCKGHRVSRWPFQKRGVTTTHWNPVVAVINF